MDKTPTQENVLRAVEIESGAVRLRSAQRVRRKSF